MFILCFKILLERHLLVLYLCEESLNMNTLTRTRRFLKRASAPDTQLVTVATDKLKDKGIDRGDLLLADPHTRPKPGELAVEEEDGKLRVKVANEKRKGGKVLWVLKELEEDEI